jgi:hypothetical protein
MQDRGDASDEGIGGGAITSSLGRTPAAAKAICNAPVPLLVAMPY